MNVSRQSDGAPLIVQRLFDGREQVEAERFIVRHTEASAYVHGGSVVMVDGIECPRCTALIPWDGVAPTYPRVMFCPQCDLRLRLIRSGSELLLVLGQAAGLEPVAVEEVAQT